jgi:hypothetical protein
MDRCIGCAADIWCYVEVKTMTVERALRLIAGFFVMDSAVLADEWPETAPAQ